jgi:co-chaperonin GroES (HSP10)
MKAVNDYIVVQKIKQGPKKIGGLILTEDIDKDNRYIKATTISVGNLVQGIKEKDVVYYDKHAGHGVQYKDTLYQVIKSRDVVLVD